MKFLKKKKLNHIINENPRAIIVNKEEYEGIKKIFCQAKKWRYEKNDGTINVRRITITANYKWHPAIDVEFDIEVEPDLDLRRKKIKLLQKVNVDDNEKPYISIPGERK